MLSEQVRLFFHIAQNRSVSRAAKLNQISQSAASQGLAEMERRLGTSLVDRSRRPLQTTPAGKLYFDYCRDALRRWEQFEVELEKLLAESGGCVRVASIYSVGLSEMAQLEQKFALKEPEARLEVEYLRPEKVYEAVLSDAADLGIVSYPESRREIEVIPWRAEQMVVAASPNHVLGKQAVVHPSELNHLDFIGFDADLPIGKEVDRFLRQHQVSVNRIFHFDNIQMIKEAVAYGVGISIMPARIMVNELEQGRLVAIPLAEPGLYRPLGVVHRRRKAFHPVAQSFLNLLLERTE
ncbi:MAG: LysR family transcriptional regulator [Bryobacteraceae bacterium]|nr:LysR family transcriptional regulator [Bryobacteraceae bacterium]